MSTYIPSPRRLDIHYIIMQAGFWAMFAGICAFQAALLTGRGFSNTQVGIIIAVRCLAGIICQPLLGGFADRHPRVPLRLIVSLSLGLSLLTSLVFLAVPMGLAGTLVCFFILGGFEISAYPLMDSMAIQYINAGVPIRYSLGRGVGSLSYAICALLMGFQVARMGVESTLITHGVLVAVEILLVATFPAYYPDPAAQATAAAPSRPQSSFGLLRSNPRFTLMLFAILFSLTAILPMSNFLVNIIVDHGGTTAGLSPALFLMAGSELITTVFFWKALNRFGSGRLLLCSMIFMALKGLFLLLAPSLGWIYLIQPIQMLGYGLFTPASVYFVNESVPAADRVRGQTLMMVASNGFGGVLGALLPGRILDMGYAAGGSGGNWMLLFCVVTGAVGVLLGLLALKKRT